MRKCWSATVGDTMRSLGEQGLLARLAPLLHAHTQGLPLGTGDDAAITEGTGSPRLVWTIDTMVESTHFRWWNHPLCTPHAIGWKLAQTNLSDLASKGADPLFALLSVGIPGSVMADAASDFVAGVADAISAAGARLIGGDTVASPVWTATLALVGALPDGRAIAARSNARPGMSVFVTGHPGESGAGLEILEGRLAIADVALADHFVARHLRPVARLDAGRFLVEQFRDIAMLDLSDGIAIDAQRIAEASGVCVLIEESLLPKDSPAEPYVLTGGESYELLFCVESTGDELPRQIPGIRRIGHVEAGSGAWLMKADGGRVPLGGGFRHFQ